MDPDLYMFILMDLPGFCLIDRRERREGELACTWR